MADTKWLKDENNVKFFPRTHINSVKDDDGNTVGALLGGKANAADVYTKTQVDTALGGKQDEISSVTVAVDANTGTPIGTVSFNNNTLAFSFQNLKGETGADGPAGPVGPQGPQGPQGSSGYSGAADELEVVNDYSDIKLGSDAVPTVNAIAPYTVSRYTDFTYQSGYFINSNGVVTRTNNYYLSQIIPVTRHSEIHVTTKCISATKFAVVSKAVNNNGTYTYVPLTVASSLEEQEYIVVVDEDMEIRVSGTTGVTAYIAVAGSILSSAITLTDSLNYLREDIPYSMSGTPILLHTGDVLHVMAHITNNNIVQAVTEEGTAIRTLWRPLGTATYNEWVYTKTGVEDFDYVSILLTAPYGAYAYIIRKKPLVNIFIDDVLSEVPDSYYSENASFLSGNQHIAYHGAFMSSNQAVSIIQIENKGYKFVRMVTKPLAATPTIYNDDVAIAFYNDTPSKDTFIPIYSIYYTENECDYNSGPYVFTAKVPENTRYICFNPSRPNLDIKLYKKKELQLNNDICETFANGYYNEMMSFAYQHFAVEYLENGSFSKYAKVDLKMLFYTDLHASNVNLVRILKLGEYLKSLGVLDCIVSGGDNGETATTQQWYDFYNYTMDMSTVDNIIAVGNHDASTRWSGTKALAYNNNIAPVLERVSDIVAPSDSAEEYRLYYYKDYGDVRLIVIYTPVDSTFADNTQLPWLQDVLSSAKTDSKHVVIVSHHMYNAAYTYKESNLSTFMEQRPNTFMSAIYTMKNANPSSSFPLPTDYLLAVKSFEDAGGNFVCWLTGHTHSDGFYDVSDHTTYGYQPMFNSSSCNITKDAYEFTRKRGDKSMDLFNYITVDTKKKMLNILRIGCNLDNLGRSKKVLTYHYGSHCIVSNY